ncbi:substrate-binding domain-containing protein [Pedobacter sp. HMF7647]|uniref:Substrate-binding domain-containing protein n=1 Tax=Hufsiella arboris TaxID=2695275 RepID=A0A7K1YCH6_9SPHI|nr:LacI family DNA-binding transcriptional regulator [Hufsiella arboris]MXV52275.1 substrate-binding domain-containing protein [Hufsiella arboris]
MKHHQITIVDIAKQLNTSKSTVSRALTGHPKVSPEKRKAILDLAHKLDYQKNLIALSLVKRKTNTIGVIVPEFSNSFFPHVVMAVQKIASQNGYSVIISQSDECYETEVENARVMLANHVDGLLVSISKQTTDFEHFKVFERKGIPLVFFNRICNEMQVPKIIVDDRHGAFQAVEHLIKIGKKRIAHLAGPQCLLIGQNRMNGYLDAMKKYDIPVDEELIKVCDLTVPVIKDSVNALMDMKQPPDGLFAFNDPTAIEAIRVVKSRGFKIPDDIAIAGFSNEYVSSFVEPSLTTVAQPIDEIGRCATNALFEQMKRDVSEWKAVTNVLNTELIIRNSTLSDIKP